MQKRVCAISPDYNIGLINMWLMYNGADMRTNAGEIQKILEKNKVDLSEHSSLIVDDL